MEGLQTKKLFWTETEKEKALREGILDSEVFPQGFQPYRSDRASGKIKAKDTSSELKDKSIRRDMTPTEKAKNAALVKKLKEKQTQAKNEKDQLAKWMIRRGAVVNVGKYLAEEEEGEKED